MTIFRLRIGGGYVIGTSAAPAGAAGGDVSLGIVDAPLPGEVYVNGSASISAVLTVENPPGVFQMEATASGQASATAVEASDPEVWFALNFDDYSTIEDVWAVDGVSPRGYSNVKSLATGLTTPWGGTKAVRVDLIAPDSGSGGIHIMFPDADTDQPRDIWMEMWFRFADNWKTNWGGENNPDHKFWLSYPEYDGAYRWEIKVGNGGRSVHSYIVANGACENSAIETQWPDRETYFWNDEWVRWRQRMKWHTSGVCDSGLQEIWVYSPATSLDLKLSGENPDYDTYHGTYHDGQIANDQNVDSKYWRQTLLSDIVNQKPTEDTYFYIGNFRAWITDPGW